MTDAERELVETVVNAASSQSFRIGGPIMDAAQKVLLERMDPAAHSKFVALHLAKQLACNAFYELYKSLPVSVADQWAAECDLRHRGLGPGAKSE